MWYREKTCLARKKKAECGIQFKLLLFVATSVSDKMTDLDALTLGGGQKFRVVFLIQATFLILH